MKVRRNRLYFIAFALATFGLIAGFVPDPDKKAVFRVAFYNVENLFDTENDSLTNDDEYTPEGNRAWTDYKYNQKLNNIYKVMAALGEWDGVDVIGLSEIENRKVLDDLVSKTPLSKHEYGIIHRESPDRRGIDVALLYKRSRFKVVNENFVNVSFPFDSSRTTREILHATLVTRGRDTVHFIVNHWPSRWGGEERSRPYRIQAAKSLRSIVDSLIEMNNSANILIMGDFNDTPQNQSLTQYLKAADEFTNIYDTALYNLSANLDSLSIGTHKYQGHWSLLDQIIVSGRLLDSSNKVYTSANAIRILQKDFLLVDDERYTGKHPYRTYNGFKWQPGFSDHLPVFIDFFEQ